MSCRINNLRKEMASLGVDAVIVTSEVNIRYLSEFAFEDGYLFITSKSAHLVTDFRYYEMALAAVDDTFSVVMPKNRDEYIWSLIRSEGIASIGFEGVNTSFALYNSYLERFKGINFIDIKSVLTVMRQIKTQDELDKMQKAQSITDTAFMELLGVIKPDMTEIEVAAELEYRMKRLGADGFAFGTIAVSGDASALPHGTPRNVKLKPGFLTMDFGARYDGYCSDMTRTVVVGRADNEIKKIYNTVLSAQLAAIDFLKEGRDCFLADKVARDIINVDFNGTFGHSLGHSIGLECHEMPALSPKSEGKILVPGNVVTVEPGIYLFGKYGCRIEDMVAIKEDGIHNFTSSPKDLIEIC